MRNTGHSKRYRTAAKISTTLNNNRALVAHSTYAARRTVAAVRQQLPAHVRQAPPAYFLKHSELILTCSLSSSCQTFVSTAQDLDQVGTFS